LAAVEIPQGADVEFVIVDNGSTDETAEVVRRHSESLPLRRVIEQAKGLSNARNSGLAQSSGDIIVFSDDDIRFPQNWIQGMTEPILKKRGDVVAGQVRLAPHLERPWMQTVHRSWLASTEHHDPQNPGEVTGANMAFSRDVLTDVPSFDSELGAGALGCREETLFSWQVLKAGRKISPSACGPVIHHFDEKRLLRSSWLGAATAMGKSSAYVDYHWNHTDMPSPALRQRLLALKLALRRMIQPPAPLNGEGITPWELSYVGGIGACRQSLDDRERPRNYARHGLRKNTLPPANQLLQAGEPVIKHSH
jgi:hypothetical protein